MQVVFPGIKTMTPMSPVMYRLACHMAHLSERDGFAPVMAYPIAAIVHAAVSLEAFLNEEMARYISADEKWKGPLRALDRLETESKWQIVPQLLFGRTIPKGAEPFQSFHWLNQLRNELVHYHAEFTEDEKTPSFAPALKARFEFTKLELPSDAHLFGGASVRASWQNEILNAACARWACMTAREMVLCWHELMGDPQSLAIARWQWSLNFLEGNPAGDLPEMFLEEKREDFQREFALDSEVRRLAASKRMATVLEILEATNTVVKEFVSADPHHFVSGQLVAQQHAWARHQLVAEAFCSDDVMKGLAEFQVALHKAHITLAEAQSGSLREEPRNDPDLIQRVIQAEVDLMSARHELVNVLRGETGEPPLKWDEVPKLLKQQATEGATPQRKGENA